MLEKLLGHKMQISLQLQKMIFRCYYINYLSFLFLEDQKIILCYTMLTPIL